MPRIKACLFDMDGLLIDSERIYTETTLQLLRNHGCEAIFPISIKSRMMGRPGPEAARIFLDWAGLEMTVQAYQDEQTVLQRKLFPHVAVLPGARALLNKLASLNVPVALATSSTRENFLLKSSNLRDFFDVFGNFIICGDDERVQGRGKPSPDIFVHSLADINEHRKRSRQDEIQPDECLVFEDGVPGVAAGLSAGNHVLWVPDEQILELHQGQVEQILGSRGKMVKSLEDFDWEYYGLT